MTLKRSWQGERPEEGTSSSRHAKETRGVLEERKLWAKRDPGRYCPKRVTPKNAIKPARMGLGGF